MTDPLVSTSWLADHLSDTQVRIFDCRYDFDAPARARHDYEQSHIPGALYLDWTHDISEPRDGLQYMAPSAAALEASMRRLGVANDTVIVGYDEEGGHQVSRLWLILRHFGNDNVRLLEGGWTKWQLEQRPVYSGNEPAPPPGSFCTGAEQPGVLASADDVLRLRDWPGAVLLDVRRMTEFTGEEARSKHGGHIPWAQWMLWTDNLNWSGDRSFRPSAEIAARFADAGVTPDKDVIVYCHGGVRAAHTALVLSRLGYEHVRVYDGSWEEWGGRDDLPIARGAP
ncbi:MAG TPA: sulfurtransferase [Chloroflexota bacterium]|jgi:thiosulfate/3-mercaptopyruvate sulfurtransferase